jgi:hypothetical protein
MTSHSSHSSHGPRGSLRGTKEILYFIFCIIIALLILASWGVYAAYPFIWAPLIFGLVGLAGAVLGAIAIWIKHRVLFFLTFLFLLIACCLAVLEIVFVLIFTIFGYYSFIVWIGVLIFDGAFIVLSIFVMVWTWQIRGGMKW